MSSSKEERRLQGLVDRTLILVGAVLLFGWIVTPHPSMGPVQGERAKTQAAKSQLSTFKTAINLYAVDNGSVPTAQQGLQALVTEPTSSPRPKNWQKYLTDVSAVPKDPWGNEYVYQSPGPHGEPFLITSYGPDGKPGGDDITGGARDDENR